MINFSIFEILMLICFGLGWPISIIKTLKCKTVEGKSIFFLFVIEIGYLSGIVHKFLYNYDWVTYLYMTNFTLVFCDIMLWFQYSASKRVKESIQTKIMKVLAEHFHEYTDLYDIKIRRIGQKIFIELFLEFHPELVMAKVYNISEEIRSKLTNDIKNSEILIVPKRTENIPSNAVVYGQKSTVKRYL